MKKNHRYILPLLIFLFFFLAQSREMVTAQFKVEPKDDIYGLEEEPRYEYYSPARYNRVEGFYPALGITVRNRKNGPFAFSADAGYGVANKAFGYHAQFEYKLPFGRYLKIGGGVFQDLFSNDEWIMGRLENSFAALLFKEDFLDYYRARGVTVWGQKEFGETFHLRLAFWSGDYESVQKQTDWSIFGGKKKFRPNPPVSPGRENKLRLEWIVDQLDNPIFPLQGWYLEGALEKGNGFLGGDDNLKQFGVFITGKIFQPSFGNQRILLTLRYGYRGDSRAPQHLLDLGGIGTLRGYRFKEYQDRNNLLFGSVQYYFGGDLLQKLPLQWVPFYSSLGLILFAETGALWNSGYTPPPGEPAYDTPQWKSDAGFSLSLTGDFVRVDFARRLDRARADWRVTFRVLPKW